MGLDKEDRSYCLMARAPIRQLLGLAEGSWSIFFFKQDPSNKSDSVDASISEEVLYPLLQEPWTSYKLPLLQHVPFVIEDL